MEHFSKPISSLLVQIIFILLVQPSSAQEHNVSDPTPRPAICWRKLIFTGSKFLTSITAQVKISSSDKLSGDLPAEIKTGMADCSHKVHDSILLTVQFSSGSPGFSQSQYKETLCFEEPTLQPKIRIRTSNGNSPWIKSYYWQKNGVRRLKFLPEPHENTNKNKHILEKSIKRTVSFYAYPSEVTECETISDPSLVLYILSTLDPDDQRKSFELCVFGKKQLHRLTIKQGKTEQLNVSYTNRSSFQEIAVEEQIISQVYSITTDNFASDSKEPEAFLFWGLNKDICIYMDTEKHLPVRISGRNNSIGNLVLNLSTYSK